MNKDRGMRKNHYPLRGYISTNRSKHNLKAHLILVCKYRKKLLQGDLNHFIKSVIEEIAAQSHFIIIAMESDIDHLHFNISLECLLVPLFLKSNRSPLIEFGAINDLSPYCKNTFGKKKLFGLMDFLFALLVKLILKLSRRI